MEKPLVKKLSRTSTRGTKQELSQEGVAALLEYLKRDRSVHGTENEAIVLMLVTSGLRAAELCSLNWADIF
jgi:integrase